MLFYVRLLLFIVFLISSTTSFAQQLAFYQTAHDRIPNFAQQPTKTLVSGLWSTQGVTAQDVAWIPPGVDVTLDVMDGQAAVIGISGTLRCTLDASTRLTVGTLQVQPGGRYECGTEQAPLPPQYTHEVLWADTPILDPSQYSNGLLAIDGTVSIRGATKTTFVRLATEPKAGDTRLTLASTPIGWRPGDALVLPDTRQCCDKPSTPQWEELQIASIQGAVVTLAMPLRYHHFGAHDPQGALLTLPHVANLTRNVIVRSENPAGTRGHTFFTGNSTVDIQQTACVDLGRTTFAPLNNAVVNAQGAVTHLGTNQVGRYWTHLHHITAPMFTLAGNAIHGTTATTTQKWGITVHDSKNGIVIDNVVYNVAGAGVAFEEGDGFEDNNLLERNMVVRVAGWGCSRADDCFPGREGVGYWFHGTNNSIRNNIAANVALHSYTFYGGGPFLEFVGNETYGGRNGLTMWEINGATTGIANPSAPQSVIKDFTAWHMWEHGVGLGYPIYNITFDGLKVYGNPATLMGTGWNFGDYMTQGVKLLNPTILGMRNGIMIPQRNSGLFEITGGLLQNGQNIINTTIGAPGGVAGVPLKAKSTLIRGVRFAPLPGRPSHNIVMGYLVYSDNTNVVLPDTVRVEAYNGQHGVDFQVYYHEQTPTFVMPQTGSAPGLVGAPVAGLTNAQTWAQYGLAIAGAVAPCNTQRPEITGFACALVSPYAAPTGLRIP